MTAAAMKSLARYTTFALAVFLAVLLAGLWIAGRVGGFWPLVALLLAALGVYDVVQRRHSVLRNYPIIGHLRFLFEFIRPELRQYFFESDTDSIPFSRQQRAIVYQRAKQQIDSRPFGTHFDVYQSGYEWLNHSAAPAKVGSHDFRVPIGAIPQASETATSCSRPYSASVFNISAMSFGALSANAVRALNKGAALGNFAHDTGEGGVSRYHLEHGGGLIWNIGSGYFGCRDEDGGFSEERFAEMARRDNIRMIEVKLSQGAKPGHGGILPAPR